MKTYLRSNFVALLVLAMCRVARMEPRIEQGTISLNEDMLLYDTLTPFAPHSTALFPHKPWRSDDVVFERRVPIMFAHPYKNNNNNSDLPQCTESIEEFPNSFTKEQLQNGALVVPFLVAAYCFALIAAICDDYFIPCIEHFCTRFKISKDVAAAVFMSIATSTPELFTNFIGTFITKSDIGLGAIVGSSMFNTLGVAALGSLAATKPIKLDWWPLCRDVVIYITAILMLVTVTWDGVIHWWEALILTLVYIVYFIILFQNPRISHFFRKILSKRKNTVVENPEDLPSPDKEIATIIPMRIILHTDTRQSLESTDYQITERKFEGHYSAQDENGLEVNDLTDQGNESLFKWPTGTWYQKGIFFFMWPNRLVLSCTIPNPARYPHLHLITFGMCIVWMGITSYLVSWMVNLIGYALEIPDAILGLTFLAIGGCLPEAISFTIMSRKGDVSMGVSNMLGANTMNILLSLGGPWLIKAAISTPSYITIQSGSIEYTILALILAALILFITLAVNRFRLSKSIGVVLALFYTVFIVLAVLSELVFFASITCTEVRLYK